MNTRNVILCIGYRDFAYSEQYKYANVISNLLLSSTGNELEIITIGSREITTNCTEAEYLKIQINNCKNSKFQINPISCGAERIIEILHTQSVEYRENLCLTLFCKWGDKQKIQNLIAALDWENRLDLKIIPHRFKCD